MDIEDFEQIAEAHKVHSRRVLDNLRLTINLTDMPEHKEYSRYYLSHNWLVRFFLQVFRKDKLDDLRHNVQVALLFFLSNHLGEISRLN